MANVHGQRSAAGIRVDEDVVFLKNVIQRYASPWSKTFFVDGENGATTNSGQSPSDPLSTIQGAVTLAGRGDTIFVRPQQYTIGTGFSRYTEDVSVTLGGDGGSAAHATNADISIVGVTPTRNPEYGVRWKYATTQCLKVDAPALHLENLGFYAEDGTYAIYLRNNGATYTQRGSDGFTMYNCTVKGSGVYVASGGDGFTVDHCTFHPKYDGTSGGIGMINYSCSANPGVRAKITNCHFYGGNVTEAPATAYITVLPPMTQMLIAHNVFGTIPTDGHIINLTGASNTGQVVDNFFAYANVVLETSIHIGGCLQAGNWDVAGIVV